MRLVLRHAWLNLWDKHMTTGRINQVAVRTWVGTARTSEVVRAGPAVSVSGTSYGSKSRVRRHPSQQTKFPVRIRIFWLLRRESFARTLKTTPRQDRRVYTISVRNTKQALSNLFDFWIEIRITKYRKYELQIKKYKIWISKCWISYTYENAVIHE